MNIISTWGFWFWCVRDQYKIHINVELRSDWGVYPVGNEKVRDANPGVGPVIPGTPPHGKEWGRGIIVYQ